VKRTGPTTILGVILAGGKSRRMDGRDKATIELGGKPLIAHAIDRVTPQVDRLILNANDNTDRLQQFALPIVGDVIPDHAGPLAGILSAMIWAQENSPTTIWVASFPTDAPFLPNDLVTRLLAAICEDDSRLACATSLGRTHPVVGLWPISLVDDLMSAMRDEEIHKIDLWTARHPLSEVEWPADPVDPFMNINTPEDLVKAEALF
jgi:molybdopterin-guanine dinucleotide biosynthesis protein A